MIFVSSLFAYVITDCLMLDSLFISERVRRFHYTTLGHYQLQLIGVRELEALLIRLRAHVTLYCVSLH